MTDPVRPVVSVIVPIHNGEKWISSCFESIINQSFIKKESLEISVFNDCSTDGTLSLLREWEEKLSDMEGCNIIISTEDTDTPRGVGYAKNRAVEQSKGIYLCFQDIDDVMLPGRISKQLELAKKNPNAIVGCKVKRKPENSTQRFVTWANNLPQDLLKIQIYTSHGPTVLMPTWFCHRSVFSRVGGFSEEGKGVPEDLIFFYRHLDMNGDINRVDDVLLIYTYHPGCTTFSVDEKTIWDIRLRRLEDHVLPHWPTFTIWNAGKQGRKLYRSLTMDNKKKVVEFCDVDVKKTGKYYEPYCESVGCVKIKIPIVHFMEAKPPFVICVKLDLTNVEDVLKTGMMAFDLIVEEENIQQTYGPNVCQIKKDRWIKGGRTSSEEIPEMVNQYQNRQECKMKVVLEKGDIGTRNRNPRILLLIRISRLPKNFKSARKQTMWFPSVKGVSWLQRKAKISTAAMTFRTRTAFVSCASSRLEND